MNVTQFIKRYGTHSTSVLLRNLMERLLDKCVDLDRAVIEDIARDLEQALSEYAADDIEPPTVDNRVI